MSDITLQHHHFLAGGVFYQYEVHCTFHSELQGAILLVAALARLLIKNGEGGSTVDVHMLAGTTGHLLCNEGPATYALLKKYCQTAL